MMNRFTYRELTVLAGIIVALIVVLTLWFSHPVITAPNKPKVSGSSIFSTIKKEAIRKYFTAFEELP